MPTYQQLNQRNPCCDIDRVQELRALYEGGKSFQAKLHRFLPKLPAEPDAKYAHRCQISHYQNYVGPIVDFFTAMLFSTRVAINAKDEAGGELEAAPDYYSAFTEDCDQHGTRIDAAFKDRLNESMVTGFSWIRIHEPEQLEVESRADFDALRLGDCWIETVDQDRVLDWEDDGKGLEWAIVHTKTSKRTSIGGSRDRIVERWEFLTKELIDTYEVTYTAGDAPAGDREIPRIGSRPHGFGQVPLVCLDLPAGLQVLDRLESPQRAHFRLSNAQAYSLSATCYAQPVFKLEDTERMPTMGAGFGIIIGERESMEWMAPPTAHFAALADEIKSHKDELFRIAQQMALGVDNNAAAVGRSAESKAQDAASTRVVLLAYARIVKETIKRVYDIITARRGESLSWSVEGLDDFAAADVDAMLDGLKKISDGGGIPSATFYKHYKTRTAEALLSDLPQAEKVKMRKEIEEGVEEEMERASELEAMTDELRKREKDQDADESRGNPDQDIQ